MSDIMTILTDAMGPLGPILIIGGLGVVLIIVAVVMMSMKPRDPFKRVQGSTGGRGQGQAGPTLRGGGGKADALERFSNFLEPQDAEEFSEVRKLLISAGYRAPSSVRVFYFLQLALGLGLLALGALFLLATAPDKFFEPVTFMKQVMLPGCIGYVAPKYWVNKRVKARNERIAQGFPDSLDMMLVCVEAGQSLDQAIVRVAGEMRTGFPDLSEEFEIVAQQMKAGRDKQQVLRDMAERLDNDDVSSFVTTLIQSQTYGTPISEALRVYAAEMRDKRVMRAEEKANKLPTKMTLATMLLTVPPLLLILIGPSLIDIGKLITGDL